MEHLTGLSKGKNYKLKVSLLKMITDAGSGESIKNLNDLYLAGEDQPGLYDNEFIQVFIIQK